VLSWWNGRHKGLKTFQVAFFLCPLKAPEVQNQTTHLANLRIMTILVVGDINAKKPETYTKLTQPFLYR